MKTVFISCFILLACNLLFGQQPDRHLVQLRIDTLRTIYPPLESELPELNGYLKEFELNPVRNDTVYGHLLQRIGALHFMQQNFEKAVIWTQRSADVIHACDPTPGNHQFLMRIYNFLSLFYDSLNMPSAKIEAIDSFINLAFRADHADATMMYHVWQRVDYSFDRGDYQRSLEYSTLGRNLLRRYSGETSDSSSYDLNFFTVQANAMIHLRRFSEAEKMIRQQIEFYRKNNDEKNCGIFYNQLSECSSQKRDYDAAVRFLNMSLKSNRAIHFRFGCKQTLNNIGFLYLSKLKKTDSALLYFSKAMQFSNDRPENSQADLVETLNIFDNIAVAYSAKGRYDSAALFFSRAFAILRPGLDETGLLQISSSELPAKRDMKYVTALVKDKGDSYRLQYLTSTDKRFLKKAISCYRVADQMLTRVRAEQAEVTSGLAWRANSRNLYESAIEASLLAGENDIAFYFFEKSRAALLKDQVSWQKLSTGEDIRKQVQLKRKLADLQQQLTAAGTDSTQYADIQKDIYLITRENDRISFNIRKRDPLFFRNTLDTSYLNIARLQKDVTGHAQDLLEIFYGDSAVYLLSVSGKNTHVSKIDKDTYDSLTQTYIRLITNPEELNRHYPLFLTTSSQLFKLIMKDVAPGTNSLIVSPDGQYFPFESLVVNNTDREPRFLIQDRPVSYTYSAGFLQGDQAGQGQDSMKFLMGMAPVSFSPQMKLSPLPGSDHSLENIYSLFDNGDTFLNASASKANFQNNFYRYRVIQLYTHGSGGNANEEPQIYFADSALKLSDIDPVLHPETRLIVLSGCETGNGTFYQGEGVFSFNRTFASIGIPSSIVNLWSVDNQAVYELTGLFYKYMSRGMPLDRALQQAKIEFIGKSSKNRAMPYYWAPAIIVGKTNAVTGKPTSLGWYWSIFVGILLAGGLIVYFLRR